MKVKRVEVASNPRVQGSALRGAPSAAKPPEHRRSAPEQIEEAATDEHDVEGAPLWTEPAPLVQRHQELRPLLRKAHPATADPVGDPRARRQRERDREDEAREVMPSARAWRARRRSGRAPPHRDAGADHGEERQAHDQDVNRRERLRDDRALVDAADDRPRLLRHPEHVAPDPKGEPRHRDQGEERERDRGDRLVNPAKVRLGARCGHVRPFRMCASACQRLADEPVSSGRELDRRARRGHGQSRAQPLTSRAGATSCGAAPPSSGDRCGRDQLG